MVRETKSQLKQQIEDLKSRLRLTERRAEAVEGSVVDPEELEMARHE